MAYWRARPARICAWISSGVVGSVASARKDSKRGSTAASSTAASIVRRDLMRRWFDRVPIFRHERWLSVLIQRRRRACMSAPLAVARLAPPGFKLNPVPTPTRRRGRVVVASASPSANDAELAAKDENPYEILGVDVTASKRAVRDAFRAAAKRAHPDTPGGSAKAFDALAKAADVLTDDARRAQLDAVLLERTRRFARPRGAPMEQELAALREAEDAGEVKDPAAVLEAARAYAAAEKALDAIAKRKKKAEDAEKLRRKEEALRASQAARLEITSRIATKGLRGNDVAVTMTVTSEMLDGGVGGAVVGG